MRVVGLITEYNPFHNGHRHHLRESLRLAGADASVAVMSGHFLQRGEPALVDKWARTSMALAGGVDLVLELPFPFACNSAPHFALGAVQSLDALGVADALCFGSEAGELAALEAVADILAERPATIEEGTRRLLRRGVNYPTARAEVLADLCPDLPRHTLASPNNILGIEYLRALRLTGSRMRPLTIPRLGAGYHDTEACGRIASATGIRRLIAEETEFDPFLPPDSGQILRETLHEGLTLDIERYFTALQTLLLQELDSLQGIYQAGDGLPQRLVEAAMTATSWTELAEQVKSRQWTLTRIQRLLCYVLMQAGGDQMHEYLRQGPLYLRVLGTTEKGRQILSAARTKKTLPLIADPARASATLRRFYRDRPAACGLAKRMLGCDLRATRLYGLLLKNRPPGHLNRDFFQTVVRM